MTQSFTDFPPKVLKRRGGIQRLMAAVPIDFIELKLELEKSEIEYSFSSLSWLHEHVRSKIGKWALSLWGILCCPTHFSLPEGRMYFPSCLKCCLHTTLPCQPSQGVALVWEELFCSSPLPAGVGLHPMAEHAKVSGLAPSIQLWRPVSAPELPRDWLSLCCDCNSSLPPSAQLCFLHSPTGFILRELANKLPIHRLPSETATQESNIDLNNCFLHNLRYFLPHSYESRCNSLPLKWFSSDFLVVSSLISLLLMAFY